MVEVSKKTLDDYFIQIRVAQKHFFNTERYKEEKVGILRKFVKIAREEGMQGLEAKMPNYIIDMDTDQYW